jgi:hypothetical protein
MKRIFPILFLTFFWASAFAQSEFSKWSLRMNYQDETMHNYSSAKLPDLYGLNTVHSHFSGWTLGVQRNLRLDKHFELSLGINYTKKMHLISNSRFSVPLLKQVDKGFQYHYFSLPVTLKFKNPSPFQPILTLEGGFRFAKSGLNQVPGVFFRPPGNTFLSITPGVEIALSKKIKLTLGLSYANYSFTRNIWSLAPRIGLKINF